MLKGGGALNPDGLALDLAFALDRSFTTDPADAGKALITSRRGPAAKFSRGSGATQVNAAGLIEYAPENLMINSGNVSLMSRTDVPVAISQTGGPLGSYYTLGVNATNGFHIYRNSGVTPAASASSMMWVLAKRGTARYLRMGGGSASTFDWDTLTFSSISTTHSVGDPVAVGDGWYWLPILRGPTDLIDLAPSSSSGVTFSSNETANVTVEVAAIQVSRSESLRNAAPTYYPTTTSVFYGPRFDHDPATLASKGLLIEELRTNLIVPSNNFSTWGATGGLVSTLTHQSPDNAATSFLFSEDTTTNVHRVFNSFTGVSGTTYTTTVFLKFAGRPEAFIETRSISTNPYAVFNLQTGTVGFVSPGITANIEEFPNGWWRCVITGIADLAGGNTLIGGVSGGLRSYTGSGAAAFYIFGAQVEAGAVPTSYIPTTSGTAARSADVCSIIGTDFSSFYNQSEGTMFADATPQTVDQGALVVGTATTTFQNGHFIYKTNGTVTANGKRWGATTTFGATTQSTIATTTDIAIAQSKLSYAYKLNDMAFAANGALIGTDNTGTMPTSTAFRIGARDDGAYLNGHIARIQYFRKRLPNAKLQTLTTP
jgi:hypothetical protein